MPTNNPTPNQPLNQHPLPSTERYIVGVDQKLIPSILLNVDVLLVPPPSEGGMRELVSDSEGGIAIITNNSGETISGVELVYKDSAGAEIIMDADSGPVADGALAALSFGAGSAFFLAPDDQGIFVRFTAQGGAITSGVTAYASWNDVRGVERRVFDLVASDTSVFPAIPSGEALKLALSSDKASCLLLNYDSVAHGAQPAFATTITDGVDTIPFLNASGAVAAGLLGSVIDVDTPKGAFGINQNINVSDSTGVTTTAPKIMVAFIRTNQGPVASNQGGAF